MKLATIEYLHDLVQLVCWYVCLRRFMAFIAALEFANGTVFHFTPLFPLFTL